MIFLLVLLAWRCSRHWPGYSTEPVRSGSPRTRWVPYRKPCAVAGHVQIPAAHCPLGPRPDDPPAQVEVPGGG